MDYGGPWKEIFTTMNNAILEFSHNIFTTTRHIEIEDALTSLSLSHHPTVRMHQTHSNNIAVIDTPIAANTTLWINDTDAVICNQPSTLLIKTADCLPVIITHPSGWNAAIHAGRKGTETQIIELTARLLTQTIGTTTEFYAWFGPRICHRCYQIDPVNNSYYDLIKHNTDQLYRVFGSTIEIEDSGYCTACQNDLFFSYRKEATAHRIYSGIFK